MKEEVFKDIPGYEGLYQVSSEGRVKSLERYINIPNGTSRRLCVKYLAQTKDRQGYSQVILCRNGLIKNYKVHRLVAVVFLKHIPCGHRTVIDHINNDKSDNTPTNLQLISNRENTSKDKKSNSGFTGVYKTKRSRYQSSIKYKSRRLCLGTFDTAEEAYEAYLAKLREIESSSI